MTYSMLQLQQPRIISFLHSLNSSMIYISSPIGFDLLLTSLTQLLSSIFTWIKVVINALFIY